MKKVLPFLLVTISLFLFSCESDFHTERLDEFRPYINEYDRIITQQTTCDLAIEFIQEQIEIAESGGNTSLVEMLKKGLSEQQELKKQLDADSEQLGIIEKYSKLSSDIENFGEKTKDLTIKNISAIMYLQLISEARENNDEELLKKLMAESTAIEKDIVRMIKDKATAKARLKGKVEKGEY